jgi:hypothetical protein
MSTHDSDSGQPPQRARRLVLRKIGGPSAPPAPLPPRTALPGNSPSIAAPRQAALMPATRPAPVVRRQMVEPAPPAPAGQRSPSTPFMPSATSALAPSPLTASSSTALPAAAAALPSSDSSGSGMPVPNQRIRPSLPPVVATLAAGQPEALAPHAPPATSARKAGLVGAMAGLVLVAMFVVGARIAYRLTPQPQTTAAAPVMGSAALPPPPAPPASSPSPPASAAAVADSASSAVRDQPRRRPQARPVNAAKAAAQPAESPETASPGASAAANAAPSASAGQSAPADSATSLVPVIPQGPPPEVDPLVKAVLEDNK